MPQITQELRQILYFMKLSRIKSVGLIDEFNRKLSANILNLNFSINIFSIEEGQPMQNLISFRPPTKKTKTFHQTNILHFPDPH